METNREAHQAKMKAQLDEWSAKLDVLKAKAAKAEAGAKIELHKAMDEMNALQASAKQHLDQLASASADGWKDVKSGVEEAWTKFGAAVEATWKKVV
jgi:flagellar hook-basal body complex protein FliE